MIILLLPNLAPRLKSTHEVYPSPQLYYATHDWVLVLWKAVADLSLDSWNYFVTTFELPLFHKCDHHSK